MAGARLGFSSFGPAHGVAGGTPLPFAAAAGLVAAAAAVMSLAAARTTVQKDIS